MKVRLRMLALGLGLLLGQELGRALLPAFAAPELMLVFALAMGRRARGAEGLVAAFAAGFVVDALSGAPTGLHALLYGTACALTRLFDGALYLRASLPWAAYAAGYTLLNAFLLAILLGSLVGDDLAPWGEILRRAPGIALVTGLVAGPLFPWLERLDADSDRDAAWVTLDPRSART